MLIRPVADEKKLREVNALPYDSLRPKFRHQVEELVRKVFTNARPKVMEG